MEVDLEVRLCHVCLGSILYLGDVDRSREEMMVMGREGGWKKHNRGSVL